MKQMKNTQIIELVAVLALFFTSCDKNLDNNELEEQEVSVRIRSLSVVEGGSETLTRSSLQKGPETVSMSIGDGMLMEMSIEQDESPLRANVELTPGSHFRVIAVLANSAKYHSHGDYVYGGTLTPSTDFHVKIGEEYDYICISYNSTDLPDASDYIAGSDLPSSVSFDISNDLLWCRIPGEGPVAATGVELNIVLAQRLAKVKVVVDCGYNGWKITGIAANQVAVVAFDPDCTMDWETGIISGATIDKGLTYAISDPNLTSQISNEAVFIPTTGNAVIKFKANAISRYGLAAAVPTNEKTATLTKALEGGVDYIIHVRLRTPKWAGSNIYWDGDGVSGKLTFDLNGTRTHEGYQGVHFRFGSLVGVAPNLNVNTPIYVPDDNEPTKWRPSTVTAEGYEEWKATPSELTPGKTEVPYMDEDTYPEGGTSRSSTDLIDAARNTPEYYAAWRGDICQYLGTRDASLQGYRLPISYEFGSLDSGSTVYYDGWTWDGVVGGSSSLDNILSVYGTTTIIKSAPPCNRVYAENTTMGVIFPGSGLRSITGGMNFSAGQWTNYWCGAAYGASSGQCLRIDANGVFPRWDGPRGYAFAIRCVKND
jgi:hypothetical protein